MKTIIAILLLLIAKQVQASWAAFAHVTPETQKKYKVAVSLIPVSEYPGKLMIRLNAVEHDSKDAWIIMTSAKLSVEGQELRDFIWSADKPEKDVLLITKLMPIDTDDSKSDKKDSKYYEVMLDPTVIERSYIYIDFPGMVFDGGYYYSIDLPAYLKHYRASLRR